MQGLLPHWFTNNSDSYTYPKRDMGRGATSPIQSIVRDGDRPVMVYDVVCEDATGAGNLIIESDDGTSVALTLPAKAVGEGYHFEKGLKIWDPVGKQGGIRIKAGNASTVWYVSFEPISG